MTKTTLIDSFEAPAISHCEMNELSGGKKVVDGQYILARVEGPMFAPDGDSLNGRHYTKKLWELAIQRNKDRLLSGTVLGTLGHDQEINDKAMGEGRISHKVVRMWIDENTGAGMGEIHILGTESGKALNALLRGGVQLQVSTRATGELTNRKSSSGLPIIDEDSYSFQGIDFVSKGGIASARPSLVETQTPEFQPNFEVKPEDIHTDPPIEDNIMSGTLLESLAVEKSKLQSDLAEALAANRTISSERDALRSNLDNRQSEVDRTVSSLNDTKARVTVLEGQLADAQNALRTSETFGDAKALSEELSATKALVEQYTTEFGTIEQVTEAFAKSEELVEQYKDLGSPQAFSDVIDEVDSYREMGLPEEIQAKLDTLTKFEESASSADVLAEKLATLDQYEKLGSVDDIEAAMSATERALASIQDKAVKADAVEIAKKYKMKADRVEEMLVKNGKEYTVAFLEDFFAGQTVEERYTRSTRTEAVAPTPVSEGLEEARPVEKTRADLLLERFSRVTQPSKNSFNNQYE